MKYLEKGYFRSSLERYKLLISVYEAAVVVLTENVFYLAELQID